jgi:hypothetical protein
MTLTMHGGGETMDGSHHTEYNVNTPPAHILLEPGGFQPSVPRLGEYLRLMFPAPLAPARVGSSQFPEGETAHLSPGIQIGILTWRIGQSADYCTILHHDTTTPLCKSTTLCSVDPCGLVFRPLFTGDMRCINLLHHSVQSRMHIDICLACLVHS